MMDISPEAAAAMAAQNQIPPAQIEMPRYQCHKQVWALKIADVTEAGRRAPNGELVEIVKQITFTDARYAPIKVDGKWYDKHRPEPGGYYVVYADGYSSYSPAKAFEDGYTLDLRKFLPAGITAEAVARICHEANRAYCQSIGDLSQLPWEQCPDWQCRSAINGVKFHLANPLANASASHESWLEEKRANGWTYGPVKDPEKKTHPCFVPFTALPVEQQAKDMLFKHIVDSLRHLIVRDSVA